MFELSVVRVTPVARAGQDGLEARDTLAVAALTEEHPLRERYSQNDPLHPVLKHGPRSLTYVRVFGWQTLVRNESEGPYTPKVGRLVSAGPHY